MVTRRPPHANQRSRATIRSMRPDDLDAVVQLDARVFGESRHDYFERRLAVLDERIQVGHTIALVAEEDGAVVGFVMATLTNGEFGFSEITVLMDSIAVHPGRQRHGIGQQLMKALLAESAARGAYDVYTLVNWKSWDMLKFFDSMQFNLAQTILLRRPIGETERDSHEPG